MKSKPVAGRPAMHESQERSGSRAVATAAIDWEGGDLLKQATTSVGGPVLRAAEVRAIAQECGFELAGVAPAEPLPEAVFFADRIPWRIQANAWGGLSERARPRRS